MLNREEPIYWRKKIPMQASIVQFIALSVPIYEYTIDPFNKYRIRDIHPITSNYFQFALWIIFNSVYCLRLIKTKNVIKKNLKGKLKRI